jgi:hypothetical protein
MHVRRTKRAIVALTVLLFACSGGATNYGRDTQGAFMETCVQKERQPEAICRCVYDEIRQQIPFERYVEIDKELQKDSKAVPDEVLSIVSDCASRLSSSSSTSSDRSSESSREGESDASS